MLRGFPNLMSPDPSLSASALHRDSSGLGGEGWDTAMAVGGGHTAQEGADLQEKSPPLTGATSRMLQLWAPDFTAQADDLISTVKEMERTTSAALCNAGVL